MATKNPLIRDSVTGLLKEITAPDTIDPAVLPASGGAGRTFAYFIA